MATLAVGARLQPPPAQNSTPTGPKYPILEVFGSKTHESMVFGTKKLNYRVLGPSGTERRGVLSWPKDQKACTLSYQEASDHHSNGVLSARNLASPNGKPETA